MYEMRKGKYNKQYPWASVLNEDNLPTIYNFSKMAYDILTNCGAMI